MSSVLFDRPGPRARARHRLITVGFSLLLLVGAVALGWRLHDGGFLTAGEFNEAFQTSNVRYLLHGLTSTLLAAALGIVCSVVFGALFAAGRLSDHWVVRAPCVLVIEFFRAVPVVLLMIIIYFSAKDFLGHLGAVVAALMLYNGSVLAEVFRAGVLAVPKGQSEAAYGIGLRKTQVMSIILMPQAVRFMLPAIVSQCVIVLKDTSLGALIGFEETVRRGRQIALYVDNSILVYAAVAVLFILINYALSKLAKYLEQRMSGRGRSAARDLETKADPG
ncbi:MAG: amino acid ABC transporter permease [Nocardioidaceae bacterium]